MRPDWNGTLRQPQSSVTVGFHSPLPPSPTGVAEYSAALLSELRRRGNVEVSPRTADIWLYHMGNNQLHAPVYQEAIRRPGIVVLHDALLHHFYLGSFRKSLYEDEFVLNYNDWSRQEAATLWQDRSLSAQDPRYFRRPMLKRIAESALAVIVHNPAAAQAVREHSPGTPVTEIPHFYESIAAPSPEAVSQFRLRMGIPQIGFVFAVFGYLRESKRLLPILNAFLRLRRLNKSVHLLIAGEFVSQELRRSVSPFLSEDGIHRAGHLSHNDLVLAMAAVDCCLNLRYPAAGETSGIAMRAMGAAKPVIATEGEEWVRFPETCLFRVPAGPAEAESLFETMAVLADNPEMARRMGLQAASHIQRYHSLSASGIEYWNLLCRTFDSHS